MATAQSLEELSNTTSAPDCGLHSGRDHWHASSFWARISNIVRSVVTEYGKTDSAYYLTNAQPDTTLPIQALDVQPLWFGRLVVWPERLWHNRSESTRFSRGVELERFREKASCRSHLAK